VGHEAQKEAFRRAFQRRRMAHAYLFTGPPGVGKHLFAVALAQALLCERRPPDGPLEACGRCAGCVQVAAGTHPDFFTAARPPESLEFPIELMRELCQSFSLKSARGRGKVVIIDDADDLNEESANCFLKTLEEPPAGSVLILIGSSTERQLPTIVSRCQVVRFAPLPDEVVGQILDRRTQEDPEATIRPGPELRQRLIRLGAGSPGTALALADPGLWEFRSMFLKGLTQPKLDSVGLAKTWLGFVEEAGKESAAQRQRARLVLRLLIEFLSDALALSLGAGPRRTGPEDRPLLDALVARAAGSGISSLIERCLEADRQVERRVQLVLVLEALLDALAQRLG
jgi:DNA polymerase-3 subunit delta'